MKTIDLSIIIVAWNVRDLMSRCLTHVYASEDTLNKEVIYVDNASRDGSVEMIKKQYPDVITIESDTNLGFIRANNLGYEKANGKYILMLNSDAFIYPDTLQTMVDFMENNLDCGVCGVQQKIDENSPIHLGCYFFRPPMVQILESLKIMKRKRVPYPLSQPTECDWVCGFCLITRKSISDSTGEFLRPDYFLYNDDVDLGYKIKRLGFKTICLPIHVIHIGGATSKNLGSFDSISTQMKPLDIESNYIMYRKNKGLGSVFLQFLAYLIATMVALCKHLLIVKRWHKIPATLGMFKMVTTVLVNSQFGQFSAYHK